MQCPSPPSYSTSLHRIFISIFPFYHNSYLVKIIGKNYKFMHKIVFILFISHNIFYNVIFTYTICSKGDKNHVLHNKKAFILRQVRRRGWGDGGHDDDSDFTNTTKQ